jgi:hypothetical protein
MRIKAIWTFLAMLFATIVGVAQTKISGTVQCGKPDEEHVVDVGDRPNHSFAVSKGKCTWTKPMEIAGTQAKGSVGTFFDEITGKKDHGHGYVVDTWANGDKTYARVQTKGTVKDGKPESGEGTWALTGGTGKLKGIKGNGTSKPTFAPDGSATIEIEGEYELPQKK